MLFDAPLKDSNYNFFWKVHRMKKNDSADTLYALRWRINQNPIDHFHEAFFARGRGLQSTQLETVEAEARMEGVGS